MVDPQHFSLFQHRFLTGDKPLLKLDAQFLINHTKVLLRSDASNRVWKVQLSGGKLADGWEDFAGNQNFRDGDVLVFKHYGDEIFHVSQSVASRSNSGDIQHTSNSGDIQHTSSSHIDTEDGYINNDDVDVDSDDDWEDEDDDGEDEDDDGIGDQVGNNLRKKNKKAEAESSSGNSRFITTCVTRYSLLKDRLDLPKNFTVLLGEHEILHEIDVVNESGRTWTLKLAKNKSTGVFYIRRGWENVCSSNGLSRGDLCKFKLVQYGKRPVLWLCPQEPRNGYKEINALDEVTKEKKKKTCSSFLKFKLTPSRLNTGQLSLRAAFTRENGINKPGEVILLNEDGRRWPTYLKIAGRGRNQWFYLRRGWREMCKANGVMVNDSFVLELIWEDANPVFKFCYKIENHDNKGQVNERTRKKRACATAPQPRNMEETPGEGIEGRANQRGRAWSISRTGNNSRKFQRLQPQSCSVPDQVASVKQSIVDTLNTVRQ